MKRARNAQDLVPVIQDLASRAGAAYEKQGQVFEDEHVEEVKLLERVIELATPGLPSIVNAIPGAAWRGVELFAGLFLTENGNFFLQNGVGGSFFPQTSDAVIETWGALPVVQALATLLLKQVQGREPSIVKVTTRVEKLKAIAKLLE